MLVRGRFGILCMVALLFFPCGSVDATIVFRETSDWTQEEYDEFVQTAGAAFGYHAHEPAEPRGLDRMKVGGSLMGFLFDRGKPSNQKAFEVKWLDFLTMARVAKGITSEWEMGGYIASHPLGASNITVYGLSTNYVLTRGGASSPAPVGVRFHTTRVTGTGDFSLQTYGIDFSLSKDYEWYRGDTRYDDNPPLDDLGPEALLPSELRGDTVIVTPYVTTSLIQSRADSMDDLGLDSTSRNVVRTSSGVRFGMGFVEYLAEVSVPLMEPDQVMIGVRGSIGY